MFSLPTTGTTVTSSSNPITIQQPAAVLERMLHGFYSSEYNPDILPKPTLDQLYATVKMHDMFGIDINRVEADKALHLALKQDPFRGLAYASHINDIELGRSAIQLMRFSTTWFSLWKKMSDIKPAWQLALIKLLSPLHSIVYVDPSTYTSDEDESSREIIWRSKSKATLKDIAAKFDPK